jgi:hypothetical protein
VTYTTEILGSECRHCYVDLGNAHGTGAVVARPARVLTKKVPSFAVLHALLAGPCWFDLHA